MIKHVIISYNNGLMDIKRDYESEIIWDNLSQYFAFQGIDTTGHEFKKSFEKALTNLINTGIQQNVEMDLEDVFYKVFKKSNFKAKKRHLKEIGTLYQILTTISIEINKDIEPVLAYCKDKKLNMYTVGRGQSSEMEHELKAVNLNDYMTEVVATTSDSKTESKMLEKVLKDHGFKKKETLFISTVLKDSIKIAKELGIKTAVLGQVNDSVDCSGDGDAIIKHIKKS